MASDPRKAKILLPTLAVRSSSHGKSSHAPGSPSANSRSVAAVAARSPAIARLPWDRCDDRHDRLLLLAGGQASRADLLEHLRTEEPDMVEVVDVVDMKIDRVRPVGLQLSKAGDHRLRGSADRLVAQHPRADDLRAPVRLGLVRAAGHREHHALAH